MATHDYTLRTWGHDFTFIPQAGGQRGQMTGWGLGLTQGDYLLLPHGEGMTRYRIERISYYPDPPDMWQAEVVFAPRQEED